MSSYRLVAEPRVDLDIAAAFDSYEEEQTGLGREFVEEVRAAYNRIADGPLAYQDLRGGIRRALVRRFLYVVYFAVEDDLVVVLAVLHVSRDPAEWQRRRRINRLHRGQICLTNRNAIVRALFSTIESEPNVQMYPNTGRSPFQSPKPLRSPLISRQG